MPAMMLFFMAFLFCMACGKNDQTDELKEYELSDDSGGQETVFSGDGEDMSEADPETGVQDSGHSENSRSGKSIFVYVCGAVNAPGVYELPEGARVFEALELAGGVTGEAAQELVNQARTAEDGERIYMPTREEAERSVSGAGAAGAWDSLNEETAGNGKININTAGMDELMTLTGIGEAKAQSIISHREKNGNFQSIEELMEIEGIKEGVFNKIKDDITI